MDFPAIRDLAGGFRRCAYCKSKLTCEKAGKCLLKMEARAYKQTRLSQSLTDRLIEFAKGSAYPSGRNEPIGALRDKLRKQAILDKKIARVTKVPERVSKTGVPKPTPYADQLVREAKKKKDLEKAGKSKSPKKRAKKVAAITGKETVTTKAGEKVSLTVKDVGKIPKKTREMVAKHKQRKAAKNLEETGKPFKPKSDIDPTNPRNQGVTGKETGKQAQGSKIPGRGRSGSHGVASATEGRARSVTNPNRPVGSLSKDQQRLIQTNAVRRENKALRKAGKPTISFKKGKYLIAGKLIKDVLDLF